ncbi:hypothetical protein [Halpernia frigidisoli]|uniref:Uncharacterized protein n=1 Tax=Halpernia frigidisoli TaxID=1125876 RepID=A0A1I3D6Y6_9FLAO|nr:hypothetical protein [Halpernia frigidisoli]SFH82520.1 hypothetical protein SAMN05443292_0295 [Halpernia frigidisoli]
MKKIIALIAFIGTFSFASAQSNYYNDYQNSISGVNWQSVATDLLLSTQQSSQLTSLNNRYPDYNSWDSHYKSNPNGWRTDRNAEIQRIMGPTKYKKFKNKNYKGQNPVAVYNRNKNNYKSKGKSYSHEQREGHGNKKGHGKGKH